MWVHKSCNCNRTQGRGRTLYLVQRTGWLTYTKPLRCREITPSQKGNPPKDVLPQLAGRQSPWVHKTCYCTVQTAAKELCF